MGNRRTFLNIEQDGIAIIFEANQGVLKNLIEHDRGLTINLDTTKNSLGAGNAAIYGGCDYDCPVRVEVRISFKRL